jgi:hypothetical protein
MTNVFHVERLHVIGYAVPAKMFHVKQVCRTTSRLFRVERSMSHSPSCLSARFGFARQTSLQAHVRRAKWQGAPTRIVGNPIS